MFNFLSCLRAATFLGCLPNNFLAVNAGSKLGELKSFADLYDYKIVLAGVAVCPMAAQRDITLTMMTSLRPLLQAIAGLLHAVGIAAPTELRGDVKAKLS